MPHTASDTRRRRWRNILGVLLLADILAGVAVGAYYVHYRVAESAAKMKCNLGQIVLAMTNYAELHDNRLPPAIVRDADGKALYSWRVLLLPYLEEGELYAQFHLDEPWDSEHNLALAQQRMPNSYASPWDRHVTIPPLHTPIRVVVGEGTLFDDPQGVQLNADCYNALAFVETAEAVFWTQPEAIELLPDQPLIIQGVFCRGFRACTLGSERHFIEHQQPPEHVRRMLKR